MSRFNREDLFIAPIGEAMLLLVVGGIGVALHRPLIFTSLGPTAYELIEKPQSQSARPYNIIAGHLIGLASGFAAIAAVHAWSAPAVTSAHTLTPTRLYAGVVAALLTVFGTLLFRAGQPAALSTTLLVALGSFQSARDAWSIVIAVVIITVVGEPIRMLRVRRLQRQQQDEKLEHAKVSNNN